VIVFGVVLEVRREVLDLDSERGHAQARASAAEASSVGRIELLDPLDYDIRHLLPPVARLDRFDKNDRRCQKSTPARTDESSVVPL